MPPPDEQFEGLQEMPRSELEKGSRIVQIAALLEQARREAAHVRRTARHHDVANEHVDTLSALIDKANEAAMESKESRSKKG